MVRRWPWNLLGLITAVPICYAWLAVLSHRLPIPHMPSLAFVGVFIASFLLSIVAGWRGSKWWYVVTACFGITIVLVWIGEFMWEGR
jgi:hypothetical protein